LSQQRLLESCKKPPCLRLL